MPAVKRYSFLNIYYAVRSGRIGVTIMFHCFKKRSCCCKKKPYDCCADVQALVDSAREKACMAKKAAEAAEVAACEAERVAAACDNNCGCGNVCGSQSCCGNVGGSNSCCGNVGGSNNCDLRYRDCLRYCR